MNKKRKIEKTLSSSECLGYGSVVSKLFIIDEWADSFKPYSPSEETVYEKSLLNLIKYLNKTDIKTNDFYYTYAQKRWLYSEDEWHEALALELDLIRPKIVVCLGDRAVKRILLKVKEMVEDFEWFYDIAHPNVVKKFLFNADKNYIEEWNQIARQVYSNDIEYLTSFK